MIYPSSDKIEKNVGSKYSLVIAVAKRAKQLKEGANKLIDTKSVNPITVALEEIADGKIKVTTPTVAETAARIKKESEDRKLPRRPGDMLKIENTEDVDFDSIEIEDAEIFAISPTDPDEVFEEYPLIPTDTDDNTDIDGHPIEEDAEEEPVLESEEE